MERYTIAQRTKIVTMFFENNQSVVLIQRAYRRFYNVCQAPSRNILVRNFEREIVENVRRTGRSHSGRSMENIERVRESVANQPQTSTRRRSAKLTTSCHSLQRILSKVLHLFPYKIQLVQALHPENRNISSETLRNIMENVKRRG